MNGKAIIYFLLHAVLLSAIALVCIVMTGCKTCKPIIEIHDSIRTVEVRTHDTTIVTEADTAHIKLLLRCDSTNNVLIEAIDAANGDRLQLQYQLQRLLNGQSALDVNCHEDSLMHVIQWQDSIINTLTSHTIVQERQVVPQYYKNCHAAMWILVVIIALYIAARILIKIYFRR